VEEIAERAAEMVDIPEGDGGVSSWNDLTDKPFGTETTEGVITFDGDYSKYEYGKLGDMVLVHTSDEVLTIDDLTEATIRVVQPSTGSFIDATYLSGSGGVRDFGAEVIDYAEMGINAYSVNVTLHTSIENGSMGVMSVGGDITSLQAVGLPISKEGTYFIYSEDKDYYVESVSCLTGLVETVKTLDEKYVPDSVVLESELENKGYQTESQVTKLINNTVAGLPDYLETLGYQTEEQVTALINNALGVIENGTY
jgi:hypothetical protein